MKRVPVLFLCFLPLLMGEDSCGSQQTQERAQVDAQQMVYSRAQPVPMYDYSLERDRVIGLYNARMSAAQTWSVWRSQTGMVEGDCPSSGYPLPYGVQLTAPEAPFSMAGGGVLTPQAEPSGLFTNGISTDATWVFCVIDGAITPVYVEDHVTVYPFPVTVDYDTDRVTKSGSATVTLVK